MDRLKDVQSRLATEIWERRLDSMPRWRRTLVSLARLAIAVGRDLASGHLTLRAMSLVFTTLLAFVPLIAVSFSVLKGFGVHNQLQPTLLNLLAPLGERAEEITDNIINFVENIEVGVLGAMGMAFLLYTAVSLIQKIEEAFNFTWNVGRSRTLVRKLSDYFSVMLIGPLLIFLALGITATLASTDVVQALLAIEPLGTLYQWGSRLVPWALVIAAFTFVYMLMPNTRVQFGAALFGAAVAGIAWETVGHLFARFVVTSTNYTAIYSGFAILLLFMIWLYLSWLILLTGSSIAFYRQYPEYLARGGRNAGRVAPAQQERLALAVMHLVTQAFQRGDPPPGRDFISHHLGIPLVTVERALDALVEARIVQTTNGLPSGYIPSRPPASLSVKAVLDAVRCAGWQPRFLLDHPQARENQIMERIETALEDAAGEVTLADLTADPAESMSPDDPAEQPARQRNAE